MRSPPRRSRNGPAWLLALTVSGALVAQQPAARQPAPAAPAPAPTSPSEQKRGAAAPPTHVPALELPPLAALQHVRAAHATARATAAAAAARRAGESDHSPTPALLTRPAGAGRYVCAVLVCPGADLDVPAVLGIHRRDVLVVNTPGLVVTPEAIAALEQQVFEQQLSLVLVLGHERCAAAAARPGLSPQLDATAARVGALRDEAKRRGVPWPRLVAQRQREQVLAASDELQRRRTEDRLRILPAEVTAAGDLVWHTTTADEMPLAPVK
jgi:hypothetical protein